MNKKNSIIVIVVLIALVGYFWLKNKEAQAPGGETSQTLTSPSDDSASTSQNMVTYSDMGYSPSTLLVKVGTTLNFKNNSSLSMWTASALHPSHIVYSGTSLQEHCPDTAGVAFDSCASTQPGDSWSFTFNKEGTWKYHNHVNPSHFGTIIVE